MFNKIANFFKRQKYTLQEVKMEGNFFATEEEQDVMRFYQPRAV